MPPELSPGPGAMNEVQGWPVRVGQVRGRDLLGDRLGTARRNAFIGRSPQLGAFRAALAAAGEAAAVHFLHGPGGIGKSTLMRRFADEAIAAGRRTVQVDGGRIEPTPAGFLSAAAGAGGPEPAVLLVDAFERCQELTGWLGERFLPRLPLDSVVVLAGRLPPDPSWTLDPAWSRVMTVERLGDLPIPEALALLRSRGVAAAAEPILAFAGGHPLALSLAATAGSREVADRWKPTRDLVSVLLDQLVGEVPTAEHRLALQLCAQVPSTTEGLVRVVVGERAPEIFAWLRDQPFVDSDRFGVFPSDLVRAVLIEDLRWRDVQGLRDRHDRAAGYLLDRVRTAPPEAAQWALRSLHRLLGPVPTGPVGSAAPAGSARPVVSAGPVGSAAPVPTDSDYYEDDLRDADRDVVIRTAGEAGGPAAAAIEHWLRHRPEAFRIFRRSANGSAVAFVALLVLGEDAGDEAALDPVAAAARARTRTAPPRAGESLLLVQLGGPGGEWCPPQLSHLMQLAILRGWLRGWLTTERPAWSMVALPTSSRTPYGEWLEHLDHAPRGGPVPVGDVSYQLYGHDWRTVPVPDWLRATGRRSLVGAPGSTPPPAPDPDVVVLTRSQFDLAVRAALRGWPDLSGNALLRGCLVAGTPAGAGRREEALRALIRQGLALIADDPREAKFARAVATTYVDRRMSQEAAAERLGLPFSTYRRHLNRGLARLGDHLWRLEA